MNVCVFPCFFTHEISNGNLSEWFSQPTSAMKKKPGCLGCIVVILPFVIWFMICHYRNPYEKQPRLTVHCSSFFGAPWRDVSPGSASAERSREAFMLINGPQSIPPKEAKLRGIFFVVTKKSTRNLQA